MSKTDSSQTSYYCTFEGIKEYSELPNQLVAEFKKTSHYNEAFSESTKDSIFYIRCSRLKGAIGIEEFHGRTPDTFNDALKEAKKIANNLPKGFTLS